MQLKRVCCFVLMLLALCFTAGCMKQSRFGEETSLSSVNIDGKNWSATRNYPAQLEDNASFRIDANVKSGKLRMTIEKAGEEPIYTGTLTENFIFTVNSSAGEYMISLTGESYTGQCSINWE